MDPAQPTEPPARRPRWAAPAAALGALALGAAVLVAQPWEGEPSAADPAAPSVSASRTPGPGGTSATTAPEPPGDAPRAAAPVGLSVPDAGLDVPVLPLTPTEQDLAAQSLVPPETPDGYWLTPYGTPGAGSRNTTYIAGHSFEGREAPFNALSDPSLIGSEVQVRTETGTVDYVVDSVVTHDKDTLKDSDIWNVVPNRLVIISCYTEDLWGRNVVVTASPAR
ncbi:class F sortase [Kocuria rosea]|jgi:hypothetical protein|uniref:class F sortase n=1 Tax=Kocuria rosea TaxID=1275 RepID=UPI00203F1FFB|nr:class F sortase [Kocuria rosea]MCM3687701.1 class F sortase [Kocuria rosea]HST71484.1 class F sortase [Kocuria rosea]